MIELTPKQRQGIQLLFADYPYLHGLAGGILSGEFGQVFADRESDPTVGMLCDQEFILFAGAAEGVTATEMISSRRSGDLLVPPTEEWRTSIRQVWGDRLKVKERIAFQQPDSWDRARLRQLMSALPTGMVLKQILPGDVARFAALSEQLVDIDPGSGEASLGSGIGFGVESGGTFVSGCSGWPGGGMVELEVQTHPSHRRRGLGTAVAAALVGYCLDQGLTPCWDAANEMSAGLGLKLGFINPTRYDVYIIT